MPKANKETKALEKVAPPQVPGPVIEEPDWKKALREQAKDERSNATVGVPRLTHKARVLKLDGNKLKNNYLNVVILGYAYHKADYAADYEENVPATPRCYSFSKTGKEMEAHPDSPHKMHIVNEETKFSPCGKPGTPECCPLNEFGTSNRGGGKHCSDKVRVLFLLADDLAKQGDEETNRAIAKTQAYQADIPATSISIKERDLPEGYLGKGFNQYLADLPNHTSMGNIREAITEINTENREKGGYFVTLRFIASVPDAAMPAILKRSEGAYEKLAQPYPSLEDKPQEDPKPIKGQQKGRR